jgi:hypothetical protein
VSVHLLHVCTQARDTVVLPPSLKNSVVVLDAPNPEAPGGVTKVYLLGMSHVSKVSVNQVCTYAQTAWAYSLLTCSQKHFGLLCSTRSSC